MPFSSLSPQGDSFSPGTCVSASLAEFTLTVERGRRPAGLLGLGCQQETDGPPVGGSVPVAAELGHGEQGKRGSFLSVAPAHFLDLV